MILCDTHADTLHALANRPAAARDVTAEGLRQGGVSLQTLALFIGGSAKIADIRVNFERMQACWARLLQAGWCQAMDPREARAGETKCMLSVEGCDLLIDGLEQLSVWRQAGVRMAALTWNYENCVAVPASVDKNAPLKPLGREAVKEMQRLGIAPDTSHLNERGFFDLLEMGARPVASHSCCAALCGHRRNLTDDQLRALFQAGGYVGVNFYPHFLRDDGKAALSDVCDHVMLMLEMGGEGMIGFGSDFDGIECKPAGLSGPQDFPRLLDALRARGLSEECLRGVAGENLLRYFDRIDPVKTEN